MPARQPEWWENLVNYVVRPLTDVWSAGSAESLWSTVWKNYQEGRDNQVSSILEGAEEDPNKTLGDLGKSGNSVNPEVMQWLQNLIEQYNAETARDFSREQSQTDLLNAAKQLEFLGLSSSGVLQTGGSVSNAVGAADSVKSNVSMQKYAQRMAIAKQLLSMTSSMASAGVYGHAIGAARKASAILSSQAAHSARMVTSYDANDRRTGRTISEYLPEDFDYNSLF